jgi:hypothetical protein
LVAHIVIGNFGLASDLAVSVIGDANAAGVRDPFETSRDVDAVAEDVVVIDDDVADMHADAKFNSLAFRHIDVAVFHAALNLDGAAYRVDGAGKFHQHPIAGGSDDAAAMLGDFWVDECPAACFQPGQNVFFVGAIKRL